MAHAELSPSSASRWMTCPGSVALCRGLEDKPSKYAAEGTAMHTVAELCLTKGDPAVKYAGQTFSRDGFDTVFTNDHAVAVQQYVDYVRGLVVSTGGELLVEQKLPISDITGEDDANGTSDTVILAQDELIVVDLKGGMGVVVSAEDNPQLMIYALAAYYEFSLAQDFERVRMVIHQPRLDWVSEWTIPVKDLMAFGAQVAEAADATRKPDAPLNPSEHACKFCRAKATCPALRMEVSMQVSSAPATVDDFDHISDPATFAEPDLARALRSADLIEGWVKAVRAEVERRLLAGTPVPGFKLVQGKKGNRQWSDKAEAEALLKKMRVPHDRMYDYSVISPTTAEKLFKEEVIGPRQWPKVLEIITQADGKPSVAPESDKRPALVMSAVEDDFDDMTALPSPETSDLC